MHRQDPSHGIGIRASERGINNGVIWAFVAGQYMVIKVMPEGTTHNGGKPCDGSSLPDLVRKALADPKTRGFLLDSEEARQALIRSGGTFSESGDTVTYATPAKTYQVLRPMILESSV